MEAALSLGMSRGQAMRHVAAGGSASLAATGNDFIAMIKDSALVSKVLGVQDICRTGQTYTPKSTLRFFETYNVVAFLYLVMTIGLSLLVRFWEKRYPLSDG